MHYRELMVWQRAMDAARETYRQVPLLPREETFGMRLQITRATVSIPANIAERWARESSRDTAHVLAIAHGSLADTEALLTRCEALGWFPAARTELLRSHLDGARRMLA
ncbi:unnamed protein product, partial [Phaeothamnion confervicola]